jgi:hypothetical protein
VVHASRRKATWSFGRGVAQIGYDDIHPPGCYQRCKSGPNLTCQLSDWNTPSATDGDHHMIGRHPHPGNLPARQVGDHATPRTGAKIIDSRAGAGRRGDSVEIDAINHSPRHIASPGRDEVLHDTRDGASSSWPPLSGM